MFNDIAQQSDITHLLVYVARLHLLDERRRRDEYLRDVAEYDLACERHRPSPRQITQVTQKNKQTNNSVRFRLTLSFSLRCALVASSFSLSTNSVQTTWHDIDPRCRLSSQRRTCQAIIVSITKHSQNGPSARRCKFVPTAHHQQKKCKTMQFNQYKQQKQTQSGYRSDLGDDLDASHRLVVRAHSAALCIHQMVSRVKIVCACALNNIVVLTGLVRVRVREQARVREMYPPTERRTTTSILWSTSTNRALTAESAARKQCFCLWKKDKIICERKKETKQTSNDNKRRSKILSIRCTGSLPFFFLGGGGGGPSADCRTERKTQCSACEG